MILPRSAGIQLHVTALPSGRLGEAAFAFVDWLAAAGQSWWQVLPLNPPDRHGSPYKARSAFAAWRGLLADPRAPVSAEERAAFAARAPWVREWAAFAGGTRAIDDQVRFDREWSALRAYALQRGVRLIGDLPIYVAPGSADHRAHPELFLDGLQAGAPPDAFTDLGQLWGNPLYDWPALRRRRYAWWTARMRRTLELFDLVRLDHFRGFVAAWAVPAGDRDARGGRWRRGPGRSVFDAMLRDLALESLPVIAEDLGVITPPVTALRDALGLPGMVVLQFAFTPSEPRSPHRLERHTEHVVAYSGTHDHDTLRGWWRTLAPASRALALAHAAIDEREPEWSLIELTFRSPARLAMLQLQDVLGLGSEARMNVPGRAKGSWKWRLAPGALTAELAARLRAATADAARLVA